MIYIYIHIYINIIYYILYIIYYILTSLYTLYLCERVCTITHAFIATYTPTTRHEHTQTVY